MVTNIASIDGIKCQFARKTAGTQAEGIASPEGNLKNGDTALPAYIILMNHFVSRLIQCYRCLHQVLMFVYFFL